MLFLSLKILRSTASLGGQCLEIGIIVFGPSKNATGTRGTGKMIELMAERLGLVVAHSTTLPSRITFKISPEILW